MYKKFRKEYCKLFIAKISLNCFHLDDGSGWNLGYFRILKIPDEVGGQENPVD